MCIDYRKLNETTRSSQPEVYDAVLLAELTQKLGSVEKAKEVYALFSASLMTTAAATPPLTIPVDSTAQPAVPHVRGLKHQPAYRTLVFNR